jgi:2'-5' RNA ligase
MKQRRLFFALWPEKEVRQAIVRQTAPYLKKNNGRIIPAANLHITLQFIGSVDEETAGCLHTAASAVKVEPFQLDLDTFGYYSRAKIAWLGMTHTPDSILRLNQTLGEHLTDCGYQPDSRKYSPHVSLMRKCRRPVSALRGEVSIPWSVDRFVLLESVQETIDGRQGVSYRVIEQYPLS